MCVCVLCVFRNSLGEVCAAFLLKCVCCLKKSSLDIELQSKARKFNSFFLAARGSLNSGRVDGRADVR